jgi:hypothetical protein
MTQYLRRIILLFGWQASVHASGPHGESPDDAVAGAVRQRDRWINHFYPQVQKHDDEK